MRDVLFKGKRVSNGEWVEGSLVIKRDPLLEISHCFILAQGKGESFVTWHMVDPDTVGQFTGLLDVGGVKIFEGDIIQNITPGSARKFEGPVRYSGLFCNFSVNEVISLYGVVEKYRVVGNAHDNAEG